MEMEICSGPTATTVALGPWQEMLAGPLLPASVSTRHVLGRTYGVVPLHPSEVRNTRITLAFSLDEAQAAAHLEDLLCLVRIYGNHLRLLDYSELDSLTRLLNRKTFDETFDRLLHASQNDDADEQEQERRSQHEGAAWLGVIDIDHFKRVNDNFGHLFGDEVLIRVADLLRKTFRSQDRLFRFGGEEFVVILNADREDLANCGFERFRRAVENYEFPQVGQVTCSVGMTGVSTNDIPIDVIGRADEALYFVKEHGRNQVSCYERLLGEGAIAVPVAAEASTDFDIDALFD